MTDQLSNIKATILTASGVSFADHIDAMIAHLTSAPNQWELQDSVAATGFVAELKSPYTSGPLNPIDPRVGVALEAGTDIRWAVDPDKALTGADGNGFSGSSKYSPEAGVTLASVGVLYTKSLCIEADDCLIWVLIDATKTFCPHVFCLGSGYIPKPGRLDVGADGYVSLGGVPRVTTASGTNYLISTTAESIFKAGNVTAKWVKGNVKDLTPDGAFDPDNDSTFVAVPTLFDLQVNDAGVTTQDDPEIGFTKYFCNLPTRLIGTQAFPAVWEGATQAWLFLPYNATNTQFAVCWEKGVDLSTL